MKKIFFACISIIIIGISSCQSDHSYVIPTYLGIWKYDSFNYSNIDSAKLSLNFDSIQLDSMKKAFEVVKGTPAFKILGEGDMAMPVKDQNGVITSFQSNIDTSYFYVKKTDTLTIYKLKDGMRAIATTSPTSFDAAVANYAKYRIFVLNNLTMSWTATTPSGTVGTTFTLKK